jgi:hypothetical protein
MYSICIPDAVRVEDKRYAPTTLIILLTKRHQLDQLTSPIINNTLLSPSEEEKNDTLLSTHSVYKYKMF